MNMHLGLRTLALLAFVALATAILVHPGLVGADAAAAPAAVALPMLAHH